MHRKWLYLLIVALLAWPAMAQSVRLSVNLPANGATVDRNFALSGTATPGAQINVNGTLRAGGYADSNGYWTIPLSTQGLAAGTIINLDVTAFQNGQRSDAVTVRYAAGTGSGSNTGNNTGNNTSNIFVSVNSPTNGATVPRGQLVLTGTATPSMIVEATGSLRGSVYADRQGNFRLPLDTGNLRQGDVVNVAVVARDNAGRQSNAVSLRYAMGSGTSGNNNTNNPSNPGNPSSGLRVSVNSPGNGATVTGPFTLSGSATPWQRIVVQGDLSGEGQSDGNGNWSIPLNTSGLAAGQVFNLQVYSKDGAGNLSAPANLRYAVGGSASSGGGGNTTAAPGHLSVNLPANGATVPQTFTLTGTATPGIQVVCSGDLNGQTTADGAGNWSLTLSGGQPGQVVNLSLVARNSSGATSNTVRLKYAISNQQGAAPVPVGDSSLQVSVARPAQGEKVGGPFSVSGTATPSMIVEARLFKDGVEVTHGSVYADRSGNYVIPLDTGGGTGNLELVVQARDSYGAFSAPSRVPLSFGQALANDGVQKTPLSHYPSLAMNVPFTVVTPRNGETVGSSFTITGTAAPSAPIEVTARVAGSSRVMRSSANADNQGAYTVPLMTGNLAPGTPLELAISAPNSNPVQMRVTVR